MRAGLAQIEPTRRKRQRFFIWIAHTRPRAFNKPHKRAWNPDVTRKNAQNQNRQRKKSVPESISTSLAITASKLANFATIILPLKPLSHSLKHLTLLSSAKFSIFLNFFFFFWRECNFLVLRRRNFPSMAKDPLTLLSPAARLIEFLYSNVLLIRLWFISPVELVITTVRVHFLKRPLLRWPRMLSFVLEPK